LEEEEEEEEGEKTGKEREKKRRVMNVRTFPFRFSIVITSLTKAQL